MSAMYQLHPAFQPSLTFQRPFISSPLCQTVRPNHRIRPRNRRTSIACSSPENSEPPPEPTGPFSSIRRFMRQRGALKAQALRNYGVAAIIAYGMFDALTYSISFLLSLRAYLAAGKVLTWKTLPQVLALMWGINNLSRPFRIAGALAIAPVVDRRIVKPVGRFFSSLRSGKGAS